MQRREVELHHLESVEDQDVTCVLMQSNASPTLEYLQPDAKLDSSICSTCASRCRHAASMVMVGEVMASATAHKLEWGWLLLHGDSETLLGVSYWSTGFHIVDTHEARSMVRRCMIVQSS